MKHAKPNTHQALEHLIETQIHISDFTPVTQPTNTHTRIDRHNAPLKPSLVPNPIASHSISPLEELKSLPLATRISVIGLATLRCQGRSISQMIQLASTEGDYITESLITHNHYLITRLSNWLSDHLF